MIKQNLKMRYTIVLLLLIFSTIFSLCIGSVMINPIHAVTGFFLHNDFILNSSHKTAKAKITENMLKII